MQKFNDARDWFFQKRYGMFVHFGIYAVGALHEQEQQRYHRRPADYERYARQFNPVKFDAGEWLDMAQENGCEYLVFTTKHHDGFCLWNTAQTDFNIMNTPYGEDLLADLAAECHRRDFPLELYYSVVDWHQENYPNIGRHHEITTDSARHDWDKYMAFLKAQIRELCTNYGEISGIWWDMNVPQTQDPSVRELIHSLQPSALLNGRGFDAGDYSTPERSFNEDPTTPFANPTEACNSVGVNSWGFRAEEDYFSVRFLESQMATYLALGGNYLLNAGPDATGAFPASARRIFANLGRWYHRTRPAFAARPLGGCLKDKNLFCTAAGRDLFIIVPQGINSSTLSLEPLNELPEKAVLLNNGVPVQATLDRIVYQLEEPPMLRLREIPVDMFAGEVLVFKLTFPKPINICAVNATANTGGINANE